MFKEKLTNISHVVSLGPNCMVAYQLRRYLSIEKSFPFDWWITPFDGLVKVLQKIDVIDLFNVEKVVVVKSGDSVSNPDYNILYHHDFLRVGASGNLHTGANGKIYDDILTQIPEVVSKYNHVFSNLLSLNSRGNSILFVRSHINPDQKSILVELLSNVFEFCDFSILSVEYKNNDFWHGDDFEWTKIFDNFGLNSKFVSGFE
jgi:hypothetical protein